MQTYEELLAENAALKCRVAEVESENATLRVRLAEIEARLGMNSRNSSKPPSSDPPNVAARPKRKPSGRKRGGQPGHKGTTRSLLSPDKVDRVVDLKPPSCGKCGAPLRGDDQRPTRRQVINVPPIKPDVTEYRQHTLACGDCGARTTATLPRGVGSSAFSSRIKAMLAMCSGVYRLSRRTVEGLMSDFFGVDISLGSVSACEGTVSDAVAAPVAEARKYVEAAPVVHADETGYRQALQADQASPPGEASTKPKAKAWLWVAVTTYVTTFLVHARRNTAAARELLGSFAGVLVSDRWSAYNFIDAARRQLCSRASLEGLRVDRGVRCRYAGEGPRQGDQAHVPLVAYAERAGALALGFPGTYAPSDETHGGTARRWHRVGSQEDRGEVPEDTHAESRALDLRANRRS